MMKGWRGGGGREGEWEGERGGAEREKGERRDREREGGEGCVEMEANGKVTLVVSTFCNNQLHLPSHSEYQLQLSTLLYKCSTFHFTPSAAPDEGDCVTSSGSVLIPLYGSAVLK